MLRRHPREGRTERIKSRDPGSDEGGTRHTGNGRNQKQRSCRRRENPWMLTGEFTFTGRGYPAVRSQQTQVDSSIPEIPAQDHSHSSLLRAAPRSYSYARTCPRSLVFFRVTEDQDNLQRQESGAVAP